MNAPYIEGWPGDSGHHPKAAGDITFVRDQTQKADAGKTNPLLLEVDCAAALLAVNRVLDYGQEKYRGRAGWKKVDTDRYNAAARRHKTLRDLNQLRDAESGLLHLAHEACDVLFQLQQYIEANPGVDIITYNPPPKVNG